jgi:hypothetical protein
MRFDPWKLAALVLIVACVDEVARPDIAHAPGLATVAVDEAPASIPSAPDAQNSTRED